MINYKLLENCPVFKGISEDESKKLLSHLHYQIKYFKKGELVAIAGEPAKNLYIILSGSVSAEMIDYSGKTIKIEDIATKAEIEKAMQSRQVEGKHVIPVPALEIRRNYPSIFYDSVRVFLRRSFGTGVSLPKIYEKAVVRPEYTKRGRVAISEAALSQMVVHCVDEYDPAVKVKRLAIRDDTQGYRITVVLEVPFGTKLASNAHALQEFIVDNIERFTGILVAEVNIVIDRLTSRRAGSKNRQRERL